MSKQDFSKTKFQTFVLRVNIHCDGCKKKVKKVLQKIKGVDNVSINAEQGKVVVTGNVDLNTLIKKLVKSGKHAEPWIAKKGFYNENHLNHQFNNMQIGKNGKSGGVDIMFPQGNGAGNKPKYGQNMMVVPHKEQKHVKFNMGKDEFDYSDDDFDDDQDGGFDDDDDDLDDYGFDFGKRTPSRKAVKNGSSTPGRAMHKGSVTVHGLKNGKKKSGKKGIFGLFRSLGKKKEKKNSNNGGKKGGGDCNNYNGTRNRKGKDQYQVVPGKKGSKDDGAFTIDCKSGSNRKESNKFRGGYDGNNYNGKNLGGKNTDWVQVQPNKKMPLGFEIDVKSHKKSGPRGFGGDVGGEHMGGGGRMGGDNMDIGGAGSGMGGAHFGRGGSGGANMMGGSNGPGGGGYMGQIGPMGSYVMRPMGPMGNHPMGTMGNLPAVQGLPAPVAMNNGYYQGMGPGNPYSQQQYMAMMMNQQQAHGNGMFQPMMYARPQHAMNYMPTTMPPRVSDPYTHMFSDENANACSIM